MKKSSAFAKKQITMFSLVLALALAVYLNWRFASPDELLVNTQTVSPTAVSETDTYKEGDEIPSEDEAAETDYYGEALFVSAPDGTADKSEYFSEARMTKASTRDEALDTLQKSLQKTELTEAEKNDLTKQLTEIATNITKEGTIESMIKAKGFAECVAFINNGKVKVVVQSNASGLTVSEVSQIKEIIISECEVSASGISIVEIK